MSVKVRSNLPAQSAARRRVLFVSPVGTDPVTAGHARRVSDLCDSVAALGYEVWFLFLPTYDFPAADLRAMRRRWGGRVLAGDYRWPVWPVALRHAAHCRAPKEFQRPLLKALDFLGASQSAAQDAYAQSVDRQFEERWAHQVRALHRRLRFHAVFVEYVFFSRVLAALPSNVLKIVDTIDVFAERSDRFARAGVAEGWRQTTGADEVAALRRADVVVAIQADEAEEFRTRGLNRVVTIGHLGGPPAAYDRVASPGPTVALVASASTVNDRGLEWFATEVFPRVLGRVPGAVFQVAGNICRSADLRGRANIEPLGVVPNLATVYAGADVVVNPVPTGTGLAIKSVEALSYGVPLVATPSGARGLSDARGRGLAVCASAEAFADAVASLLLSPGLRRQQAEAATQFSADYRKKQADALARLLSVGD
ncbi:MAG TPA: glycosyltransferase [Humisphaera sp.]